MKEGGEDEIKECGLDWDVLHVISFILKHFMNFTLF